jgi:DNA replicative helicase MCM subunit Mcm2 (Cdc46/Mcm family)
LRSLTKNFPARATDAHISIIGHITRDELRRLLTETESANGFANRFLWVAVRRSKCLPEGGDTESENLNDLVSRLRRAVEFAQTAGEIKRNDAARELWARVYPELSEGKPGLLGAITARAEAQVLRLSVIYALLDCSVTVQLEHLKAALALWSYCERSTGWIFATRTGDTNADKIATALRGAGSKGLTRAEISKDVFQHNLGSDALNNAFQALRHSGVAYCKAEPTATKPRERWFAQARGHELYEKYELSPQHEANNSYNSLNPLAPGQKNTAFHAPDREPQPAKPEVLRI